MTLTTMTTPIVSAKPCDSPRSVSQKVRRCPSVAPENAPDNTPISVIPIWTVDRNLPGSEDKASARRDPVTPLPTSRASRAGRAETMANSDIERRPLTTIRTVTIPSSRYNTLQPFRYGSLQYKSIHRFAMRSSIATNIRTQAGTYQNVSSREGFLAFQYHWWKPLSRIRGVP
jgi:hypothetical protein